MSYLHKYDLAISASSVAGTEVFSTIAGGRVYAVRWKEDATIGLSTVQVITVSRNTSGDVICKFMASSTTLNYFPSKPMHGSTCAVLNSTVLREKIPLVSDRIKINVPACSSKNSRAGVVTVYLEGQGYN
jgi:hypothetical protein